MPSAARASVAAIAASSGRDAVSGRGNKTKVMLRVATDVVRTAIARAAHGPPTSRTIATNAPGVAASVVVAGRGGDRWSATRGSDRVDAVGRRAAIAMMDRGIDERAKKRSGRAR